MLLNNNYFTIVGPTASGKTSLAIEVAKKINGEIIGLDSRQIYKGMKIGTAQPSTQERGGVIHHLIGCLDPWVRISAGQYAKKIHEKIHEIENKGKVPLICGGAGL
ncbi:MAG: tRNA (adenosine(37)-N6)-dimethylallyltransferase MiaA, partial [Candidatus Marinimicrobia bacterium]|nr:tRNA (adenosine(37)-N6)-dimethylallyltransferase MiaA [Candidatus Neomarinimicrobiota bacterium]